jgi:DNA polymerase (family 10)
MTNATIAEQFELLSKLMDIHGENSFKTKTYAIAAYKIEKLPQQLYTMSPEQIQALPGIGDAITKKILELLQSGTLSLLEEYIINTPKGVIDMLSIKGIGPKKIALLWKEMGIESIGELAYACNENRLVSLKGFGAKTQASILASIAFLQANQGFYLWAEAEPIAQQLLNDLQGAFPNYTIAATGAFLRQMPTLSKIEFVTDIPATALQEHFNKLHDSVHVELSAEELSVTIESLPLIQFHLCSTVDFATKQFTTSNSEAFHEAFLQKYTIPQSATDEASIFLHNNLPFIAPCLREDATILKKAASNALPKLIQPQDIKGVIHAHSTYSDGIHSLEAMAKAARDKGYEYLVISDHSQTAVYANGLKAAQIKAQHEEIALLNDQLAPFKIFRSIESDILGDGSLDYPDEVLATFDLVIASVHSNLKMTEEKAMQRLLRAIQNPYTTILGHPTGRLLLSRAGYPIDFKTLIDACVAHNVVIEINAHPRRLDLDWSWIPYAIQQGVLLSIDPDAHATEGIDMIKYGVLAAQKGGLTAATNLSSKSLAEFESWLAEIKK